MRVAYLTAGAAGMYCGSCMHDNTLAKALIARGDDCLLVPTYTPIRTDEQDISAQEVFFGGINIYLEQKLSLWGRLPKFMTHWLDHPAILRLATRKTSGASPHLLGALTVSMLQGVEGRQRAEVDRLCDWMQDHVAPDAVVLSNFLIGGCVRELKRRMQIPIVVTLQGDDIFLNYLPEQYRQSSIELMRALAEDVDAFIVNSQFYADKMVAMLGISEDKFRVIPLGIDLKPFQNDRFVQRSHRHDPESTVRIGYLARIDPAKGLHRLVDALCELEKNPPESCSVELHVAGWLGEQHTAYADEQWKRLDQAGWSGRYTYHGSPDHEGKLKFLEQVDLFCVPTEYQEPKGIFALEAMAAGLPMILPDHGVFPEMVGDNQAAALVEPNDPLKLAATIRQFAEEPQSANVLANRGQELVKKGHSIDQMANKVHQLLAQLSSTSSHHKGPSGLGVSSSPG